MLNDVVHLAVQVCFLLLAVFFGGALVYTGAYLITAGTLKANLDFYNQHRKGSNNGK